MTRNSKKNNAEGLEDASVRAFFDQIKDELRSDEYSDLVEGYECLKQVVVPSMYSEVAMTLITVIYSRRSKDRTSDTFDEMLNEALKYPLIAHAICDNEVRLRELQGDDVIYFPEEREEEIGKHFVKVKPSKAKK